jgi:membrane protein implicated in regulation of membrane protease activity
MVHSIAERRNAMFWGFILIAALGIMLIRLGMYSVWVGVLSGGLQLALLVIVFLTVALVWRRVFGTKRD